MDVVPEEDLTQYEIYYTDAGRPALARRENGDCVYLADGLCSIYDRRPTVCRAFDCRDFVDAPWQPDRIKAAARRLPPLDTREP